MNENIHEIGYDTPLEAIQEFLDIEAHKAYDANDFTQRSSIMGEAVGQESALLAARAFQSPGNVNTLKKVFTGAAKESCLKFANIFDTTGKLKGEKKALESLYKQDQEAAATIALTYLPDALQAIGITSSADHIITLLRSVDFVQVMDVTAIRLSAHIETIDENTVAKARNFGDRGIREKLHQMMPITDSSRPYLIERVDDIPIHTDAQQLTQEDMNILEMAVRLANATWKSHQVHRAHWEGNDSRIDHTKRDGVFNPYDLLKKEQYVLYTTGDLAFESHEGLLRVSWEIMKDIIELQSAMDRAASKN